MLHGKLSNQAGTTIAFRCEDFLVKYKNQNTMDKLLNFLRPKEKQAVLDEDVLKVMSHLYRNTEYNVDLVIEKENYNKHLKHLIEGVPYSRVVLIDNLTQIGSRILVGDLSYYVDDNYVRRIGIKSKYAVTLKEIQNMIRGR